MSVNIPRRRQAGDRGARFHTNEDTFNAQVTIPQQAELSD